MCTISNRLQLDNIQVYKERTCKEVGQLPGGACNTHQTLQLDNDREWEKGYKELSNCLVVCTTPTKLCSWTMTGSGKKVTKNCASCLVMCTMHNIQQTVQLDNVQVSLSGKKCANSPVACTTPKTLCSWTIFKSRK